MDSTVCVVHLRNIFTWSAIYEFQPLCRTSQKHILLDLQSMDSTLCVIYLRNIFTWSAIYGFYSLCLTSQKNLYLICNLWILLSVSYISETDLQSMDSTLCVVHLRNIFTWSAIYEFYSLCRTSQKLICNVWILLSVSYISETSFTWSAIYGFYSLCHISQKHLNLICNLWILLSVSYIPETNLWILLSVLYISSSSYPF